MFENGCGWKVEFIGLEAKGSGRRAVRKWRFFLQLLLQFVWFGLGKSRALGLCLYC